MAAPAIRTFEWCDFEYKGDIPETLQKGDVYSVQRFVNNPTSKSKIVPVFIRQHLIDQERRFRKFLSGLPLTPSRSTKTAREWQKMLFVSGPPGCGKTSFCTLLAHRYAVGMIEDAKRPKRVLLILFQEFGGHIVEIEGTKTRKVSMLKRSIRPDTIVDVVDEIFGQDRLRGYDLAIVDGIRQTIQPCNDLVAAIASRINDTIKKAIFVSSHQFDIKDDALDKREFVELVFDSFSQDDYTSAMKNDAFVKLLVQSQSDIKGGHSVLEG